MTADAEFQLDVAEVVFDTYRPPLYEGADLPTTVVATHIPTGLQASVERPAAIPPEEVRGAAFAALEGYVREEHGDE